MRKTTLVSRYSFGFLLIAFLAITVAWAGDDIWKKFVKNPNEQNFRICEKQIKEALAKQTLKNELIKQLTEGAMTDFLELVESGNEYAAELCLQLFPLFRGYVADLEFFDIALGKFLKKKPESFLRLMDIYVFNTTERQPYDLGCMLLNYGEEYVDKFEEQIKETEERIAALESVKNKKYERLKSKCISLLVQEKNLLEKIREEMMQRK